MFQYKPFYGTLMNARYAAWFNSDVLIKMDNGDIYRILMTPQGFRNVNIISPEDLQSTQFHAIRTHHMCSENDTVIMTYFYEDSGAIAFQVDDKDFTRVSVF